MFEKLKELNKLKKAQSEIKKQLEQIFHTVEKAGTRIVIRGDKRIEKIEINGVDQKTLKDLLNDASKEVDKKVEKQMRGQLKELGFPEI